MYRRMAQKWMVFAFDETDGTPHTAATLSTITGKISKDGADAVALDTAAADNELEGGYYTFTLTEAETDADQLTIIGNSSTTSIQVVGAPATQNTFNHVISGDCTSTGGTATVNTTLHTASPAGHGLTTVNALNGRVLIFNTDTATVALRHESGTITGYSSGGVITFAASTFTIGHSSSDTFKIY